MKRIFIFIIVLVAILIGLSFAVLNANPVPLDYYFGNGEFPLSLILVATLGAGCVLGVIATLGLVLIAKRETAKLRHDLKLKDKEVANLRSLPITDK